MYKHYLTKGWAEVMKDFQPHHKSKAKIFSTNEQVLTNSNLIGELLKACESISIQLLKGVTDAATMMEACKLERNNTTTVVVLAKLLSFVHEQSGYEDGYVGMCHMLHDITENVDVLHSNTRQLVDGYLIPQHEGVEFIHVSTPSISSFVEGSGIQCTTDLPLDFRVRDKPTYTHGYGIPGSSVGLAYVDTILTEDDVRLNPGIITAIHPEHAIIHTAAVVTSEDLAELGMYVLARLIDRGVSYETYKGTVEALGKFYHMDRGATVKSVNAFTYYYGVILGSHMEALDYIHKSVTKSVKKSTHSRRLYRDGVDVVCKAAAIDLYFRNSFLAESLYKEALDDCDYGFLMALLKMVKGSPKPLSEYFDPMEV